MKLIHLFAVILFTAVTFATDKPTLGDADNPLDGRRYPGFLISGYRLKSHGEAYATEGLAVDIHKNLYKIVSNDRTEYLDWFDATKGKLYVVSTPNSFPDTMHVEYKFVADGVAKYQKFLYKKVVKESESESAKQEVKS